MKDCALCNNDKDNKFSFLSSDFRLVTRQHWSIGPLDRVAKTICEVKTTLSQK